MRYTDLMSLANDTTRKATIRKRIGESIKTILIEEFGEDFVRFLDNDIYIGENGKIPNGSIIADCGDVINKDKFQMGALVEINIKVKQWNDTRTAKTDRQAITLDDIDEAIEIAKDVARDKAEKKKKKQEIKAKNIARDTARRAKEKENKS